MSEIQRILPDIRPERFYPGAVDSKDALLRAKKLERLSLEDRKLIVDQAIVLLEDNYAHLPLKRAMHAVNPVQLFKLLRLRLDKMTPRTIPPEILFHRELHSIFSTVRDLHTNYELPEPFKGWRAFLPFTIGEYFARVGSDKPITPDCLFGECERDGEELWAPRYLVTNVLESFKKRPEGFAAGAQLIFWNGVPIVRAVQLTAAQFAGSNQEARRARGLARMTLRPLVYAMPPEELWVDIVYRPAPPLDAPAPAPDDLREVRIYWAFGELGEEKPSPAKAPQATKIQHALRQVLDAEATREQEPPSTVAGPFEDRIRAALRKEVSTRPIRAADLLDEATLCTGLDYESEMMRLETYYMYTSKEKKREGARSYLDNRLVMTPIEPLPFYSSLKKTPILDAFSVVDSGEHFGLIRIRTFNVPSIDEFVKRFQEALMHPDLGRRGLIIDVRGNSGGDIPAGERILQLLTHRTIEPARFQFKNSPLNLELCQRLSKFFKPWIDSIASAVETGDTYSRGIPLTSPELCNDRGQKYHGPKILITDASCYSTTDIFAAGFQDHEIGEILGVHGNTGAGGANNVKHSVLLDVFNGRPPYKKLPHDAELSVALRRSMRVLDRSGTPLEDLGVVPKHRYRLTREDLVGDRHQLYARAIKLLRKSKEQAYFLFGWRDGKNTKRVRLCHSTDLETDFSLGGSGVAARVFAEQAERATGAEVDGIPVRVRDFRIEGDLRDDDLMEVRGLVGDERKLVASIKSRWGDLETTPPRTKPPV